MSHTQLVVENFTIFALFQNHKHLHMYTYVALHVCQGWPVNSGPPAFGRAGIHGGIVGDQILWEVESALTRKFRQEIGSSQNGSQLT